MKKIRPITINVLRQSLCGLLCTVALACQPTSVNVQSSNGQSTSEPSTQVASPAVVAAPEQQTSKLLPSPDSTIAPTTRPNPIFRPIFPALKAQTQVPVFLVGDIPNVEQSEPLYAILASATASGYQILLAFTENCNGGNACRLGSISGQAEAETPSLEGQPVALRDGITGYFVEATCGANCSDATLTWEQEGYRYTIGIKAGNEADLVAMANSAIANGAL